MTTEHITPGPVAPETLTPEQVWREVNALKELIFTRLDALDKATELFHTDITRVPTDVDRQVSAAKDLISAEMDGTSRYFEEKFTGVEIKFEGVEAHFAQSDILRDKTAEQGGVALSAALQAAKEAVGEQNKSFALSIDKSEKATAEQIAALRLNYETALLGLNKTIDDLKERVVRAESLGQGAHLQRTDTNQQVGMFVGVLGLAMGAALALIGLK